ncbi:MAG: protein arginine kinase [Novibacillus thermophilus]|mgnify:CR=1 FL=1|jgi:protein arginine kinase|uniref:Protein-arginine kinase n=1 Tax=Novibacillus thermophilus TaxID=1471761 RepID=A0A1U9K385_9BACL|nr:protein arginine kinase [Novibacillus thermophilus]AQS54501.1 protein arginine kinase [Novibacillus thermophilus]
MALQRFMKNAVSEWMKGEGPHSDIMISSRIRIARNFRDIPFPMLATSSQANEVIKRVHRAFQKIGTHRQLAGSELIRMDDLTELQRRVLVEKHLISPALAEESRQGAVILSGSEAVSIMINEEDHLRIQCLFPGLQLQEAWTLASELDDQFEQELDFAFDEKRGYLTSCPTNVGTGVRASVMVHLPALTMTQQIKRILPAVTQVGLAVRGIYGEGSEAVGSLFQISNQITLGQSEREIVDKISSVALQIMHHEKKAREQLMNEARLKLEDRVQRSLGILSHARVIDSKEATERLSDLRLGIDLGLIKGVSSTILNELMVMTQPGFLQQIAERGLGSGERDVRRAQLIRERLAGERGAAEK